MKPALRYSISAVTVAVMATLISLACISQEKGTRNIACNDIKVEYADSFKFTVAEQIAGIIRRDCAEVLGRNLSEINLARIESVLEQKSSIREAEAWTTLDGKLHIRITHRHPAVKFTTAVQNEFYSDREANLFPKTKGYEPAIHQISLDSRIPGKKWIKNAISFLDFCDRSRTWRGRVSGIKANDRGEISFTVDGSDVRFILGQPELFKEKFSKMETYFSTIAPRQAYKRVNLAYEKQIICK